jgi:hypothetical protein
MGVDMGTGTKEGAGEKGDVANFIVLSYAFSPLPGFLVSSLLVLCMTCYDATHTHHIYIYIPTTTNTRTIMAIFDAKLLHDEFVSSLPSP